VCREIQTSEAKWTYAGGNPDVIPCIVPSSHRGSGRCLTHGQQDSTFQNPDGISIGYCRAHQCVNTDRSRSESIWGNRLHLSIVLQCSLKVLKCKNITFSNTSTDEIRITGANNLPVVKESDDGARHGSDGDENGAEYSGTDVMDHHTTPSTTNNRPYVSLVPTTTFSNNDDMIMCDYQLFYTEFLTALTLNLIWINSGLNLSCSKR